MNAVVSHTISLTSRSLGSVFFVRQQSSIQGQKRASNQNIINHTYHLEKNTITRQQEYWRMGMAGPWQPGGRGHNELSLASHSFLASCSLVYTEAEFMNVQIR
jgi:hypothetical protein